MGIVQIAAFSVHVEKMVREMKVKMVVGVVGKHVVMESSAAAEGVVGGTGVEESGIGLLGRR